MRGVPERKVNQAASILCRFCHQPDHHEGNCVVKRWVRDSLREGTSVDDLLGERAQHIHAVQQESEVLLYTPIMVNGVRLPRALVDSGSEVNVLPVKVAAKHGFSYNSDAAKNLILYDFEERKCPVKGIAKMQLIFGPKKGVHNVKFLISNACAHPIIGMDTLKLFQYCIDCDHHELFTWEEPRLSVKCEAEKNPRMQKNMSGGQDVLPNRISSVTVTQPKEGSMVLISGDMYPQSRLAPPKPMMLPPVPE